MMCDERRGLRGSLLAGLALGALAACEGGVGLTAFGAQLGSASIASITVSPANATLTAIGAAQQFTAAARDSLDRAIAGVTFTWSSSNTAVVTVDSTGVARAVANGVAAVIARSNGIEGQANVTVSAP